MVGILVQHPKLDPVLDRLHAGAIAMWPLILAHTGLPPDCSALTLHEPRHLMQQLLMTLGLTVLFPPLSWVLYYWLYLIGLPFGLPWWFNPFRAFVERDAYRAEGYLDCQIDQKLRKPPYYLKWLVL